MSHHLTDAEIEAAYLYIEGLRGKIPDAALEELQVRLLASPDDIREETRTEVEEEAAFVVDTVDMPPDFQIESDIQIELGPGKKRKAFTIRYLNGEDADFLSELVPDAWQYVSRRGRMTLEEMPLAEVIDHLVAAALGDVRNGKPTKFKYKFYEALARLLTNTETGQILTVGYLRACPTSQLILAARRIWSVNHDFFTEASGVLPGNTLNEIASLIGRITKLGRLTSATTTAMIRVLPGTGTTPSSTTTSSSTLSPANTASARRKSAA